MLDASWRKSKERVSLLTNLLSKYSLSANNYARYRVQKCIFYFFQRISAGFMI